MHCCCFCCTRLLGKRVGGTNEMASLLCGWNFNQQELLRQICPWDEAPIPDKRVFFLMVSEMASEKQQVHEENTGYPYSMPDLHCPAFCLLQSPSTGSPTHVAMRQGLSSREGTIAPLHHLSCIRVRVASYKNLGCALMTPCSCWILWHSLYFSTSHSTLLPAVLFFFFSAAHMYTCCARLIFLH